MVHGGLRYLQQDPEVTYHSCLDSGAIQRIAPHLVFRIPFLMPIFPDDPIGPELVEVGLEMYDKYQPLKNGRPHIRLTRAQALQAVPGSDGERSGRPAVAESARTSSGAPPIAWAYHDR